MQVCPLASAADFRAGEPLWARYASHTNHRWSTGSCGVPMQWWQSALRSSRTRCTAHTLWLMSALMRVRFGEHGVLASDDMGVQVATRRLEVTRSFETYASSLCHPTASVLLAKSLILSAEKQGASSDPQALEDARARCASLLRSLARSAGVPAARRRGWGGFLLGAASAGFLAGAPETWLLPQCLLPVAEALYHLQRGQLLGHVVGHSDERAQLFHLFLKSDLALAQATLVPRAYQVRARLERPHPSCWSVVVRPVASSCTCVTPWAHMHGPCVYDCLGPDVCVVCPHAMQKPCRWAVPWSVRPTGCHGGLHSETRVPGHTSF